MKDKEPPQMRRKDADNSTLYLRPVPTDVKNYFKAECARRGISMLEAHIEFMRQAKEFLPMMRIKAPKKATKGA